MSTFEEQIEHRASNPGEESGGLADAVALIQSSAIQNANANNSVAVVELPEPDGSYLVVRSDGSSEAHTPQPPPGRGVIHSVDQIHRVVAKLDGAIVSVCPLGVFVHTDADRLKRGFQCLLVRSHQWETLTALRGGARFDQRQLISLLRISLMGCLDERGQRLLKWARTIETGEQSNSVSVVKSQQETLGNTVQAEVQNAAGDMPDWFDVSCRIWTDRALAVRVTTRVIVEFSPRQHEFTLAADTVAMDDNLDEALLRIETQLREELGGEDADVPVVAGTYSSDG